MLNLTVKFYNKLKRVHNKLSSINLIRNLPNYTLIKQVVRGVYSNAFQRVDIVMASLQTYKEIFC